VLRREETNSSQMNANSFQKGHISIFQNLRLDFRSNFNQSILILGSSFEDSQPFICTSRRIGFANLRPSTD